MKIQKGKLIKISIAIAVIILLVTTIIVFNKTGLTRIATERIRSILQATGETQETETKVEYEIKAKEGEYLSVFITLENPKGIEKIATDDIEIDGKGKTQIGIDRVLKENEVYKLKVKLVEEETEEIHTITPGQEETPPQPSAPSTGDGTYREGNELPFTWPELAEIAKSISNLAKDKVGEDNPNRITEDTEEVTITYNGTPYTIGVGDYTTIDGKKVRILGFNHDELVDKTTYNNEDGTNNTYAGISFEYVEFITEGQMNMSNINAGGWGASAMYMSLNIVQYNNLPTEVKNNIKQVKKAYCATYNDATLSYSNDYLWLLSCAEIWNNAYNSSCGAGRSKGIEGSQYKYYKNINAISSSNNNYLKKPSSVTGTGSTGTTWWLRSPYYSTDSIFCTVHTQRY